ncbi:MAG TPA: tetratricopeptide repeat protein [Acidobacteriaceae bacterium]|nr:tetratricopeptide repeat protein [Acidobacteriaceae bacterium]
MQRWRLIVTDTISLTILFAITASLAVVTNMFYQSYANHQATLAARWTARGEMALENGKPLAAVDALRSALAYAPDERKTEIALAEALAAAGRVQEATSYFNTLAESEPGNGMINLQLARLAARAGNTTQALDDYHRAIYGTWEGDGYVRRREVRMELVNLLISKQLYPEARNELLVAAGNASNRDSRTLMEIAGAMDRAQDPADALRLYKTVLQHEPFSAEASRLAGETAFRMGHYLEARQFLERAVNNAGSARANPQVLHATRDLLRDTTRLLSLYPSFRLGIRARSMRILTDLQIARARFSACAERAAASQARSAAAPPAPDSSASAGASALKGSLESLASRFGRHPAKAADHAAPPTARPATALAALSVRWDQQPAKATVTQLENDPEFADSEVQLIYDTEIATQQICGPPTGDDALLLKIALAPNAVEQQ